MKPVILLAAVGTLFVGAAMNATMFFDAMVAVYQNADVRAVSAALMELTGLTILAMALVKFTTWQSKRHIDADFPDTTITGIGATDAERMKRK